jgi:hypothetical protein
VEWFKGENCLPTQNLGEAIVVAAVLSLGLIENERCDVRMISGIHQLQLLLLFMMIMIFFMIIIVQVFVLIRMLIILLLQIMFTIL